MASTIRHNRARGTHEIRGMEIVIQSLVKKGWSDKRISKELGMDIEEVFRFKQVSGLKGAFSNHTFSKSWETFEECYYKNNNSIKK